MKIFWSWQSDHDGKISRFFVRDALKAAIKQLNREISIEDANRSEIVLDQDRKNVPGSPDLANTILKKICDSQVVVADVTPVGYVNFIKKESDIKPLMNSNVAIETGYALKALGDSKFLMVMNTAYCRSSEKPYDDLPFDLRHKAGLITYHVNKETSSESIESQQQKLIDRFKAAIKPMLVESKNSEIGFNRINSVKDLRSLYFDKQKPIVRILKDSDYQEYYVAEKPVMYLRISPTQKISEINRVALRKRIKQFLPFATDWNTCDFEENEFGAISFWAKYDEKRILAGLQLFSNGEIWAFNNNNPPKRTLSNRSDTPLSISVLESTFREFLPHYLQTVKSQLLIEPPYDFEAGITGYDVFLGTHYQGNHKQIFEDTIFERKTINSNDTDEIDSFLLEFFEKVWSGCGLTRPSKFGDFPL